MTNKHAQASSEVVTSIIQFHFQPIRALIDPGATHSFIYISFVDVGYACLYANWEILLAIGVVKNDSIMFGVENYM